MESSVPAFEHPTSRRRHAALLRWSGYPNKVLRHRHERAAEFGFVTQGTGEYTLGDDSVALVPGRLFYIPPGTAHGSSGVDERMHCWVLSLPLDRFDRSVTAGRGVSSVATQLRPEQARRLARMLTDLVDEPDDEAFDLGAEYVAASVLAALSSRPSRASEPPVPEAVEKAARLLREEVEDGPHLTLDALARRCGVSRSRLTELFRTNEGMSIVQFRNRERLERCLSLYTERPDQGMTRAAFDAGFGSYSQFYRTFCDVIGCTPTAYARSLSSPDARPSVYPPATRAGGRTP
ncbi:MAG: AraC family transcriptional regulator [Polyangiales bacterium]|nr:helix-turn-helix domain-containing protein [Myxococcales bacterium]MCB9657916.1 helix-turn-helix domain-containing protein [Sandaracinaceae bacterium]